MMDQFKKTEQKALEINLNKAIYGTFAEIGAGQEVARNFFQVGAAAGTIAKTMSAYDKHYSDAIYGCDITGRYVCENRLYRMLDHEFQLIDERLSKLDQERTYFVFADTVSAINYAKTIKGNGWMGLRFQTQPGGPPSEIVIHVRMLDNDNRLQQEAIGVLGVNLIYSCYYYRDQPEKMVQSLIDSLDGRVFVDLIRVRGEAFDHMDNRLLVLYLVKHGLTEVTIFDTEGKPQHASEFLYKKSLMVVRGNFRPPTLVTSDVFKSSFKQFCDEPDVDPNKAVLLSEITLEYLTRDDGKIHEADFLARAELLGAMGHSVILSNCDNHQHLITYMSDHKVQQFGIVIGVHELLSILKEKYEQNQDGRLLVAFGELFTRKVKVYAYPALKDEHSSELWTAATLPVPEGIKFLYRHLLDSEQIVEVQQYNAETLKIFPHIVFSKILNDEDGWEDMVPEYLAKLIKEKGLYDFAKTNQIPV